MLKGDLNSTPLAPLLVQLADEGATGCLHVSDVEGDEALIYFKAGQVYAVSVPGRRPQLGAKLVSSGALAPEALADALEAQRTELQGWRLGELLVHLGYVDQPVVEAFIKEQVHDALWDLMRWADGRWKFRKNEKTREDVAPPVPVTELLANLRERGYEWETISTVVHGPTAVPVLSTGGGGSPETVLDPDAWSMLCKIDGERSVAELARDCGYTLFEAGQILVTLVSAGLVDIEEDVEVVPAAVAEEPAEQTYGVGGLSLALAAVQDEDVDDEAPEDEDGFAALARVVSEVAAGVRADEAGETEQPSRVLIHPASEQSFASSLARVSEALSNVLGPAEPNEDPFAVPNDLRTRRTPKEQPAAPEVTPEQERRQRTRAAAAAELAAAHALAEALRAAQNEPAEAVADVVDLDTVRREAVETARVESERQVAEDAAQVEAAEEEAARVAAEEEAARVAAEEEAARIAAEEEAARIAAEEEAARLEAERLAAEEAARVAAEEEAARVEAERLAAEEAERLAADEAARIAADEEAARLEAERLAAEEEAARVAAEEEAARVAAEEEAARIAAEEEAARLEAERLAAEEAERLAAEADAAREAAEEAERLAAAEQAAAALADEVAEAESEAWSEYWQREADTVQAQSARDSEAASLLAELAAADLGSAVVRSEPEPEPEPAVAEYVLDDEPEVDEPAEVREPAAVGAPARSEYADTAALLRELSSLGVEDDGPSPSAPTAPRARPVPVQDKKKKRGLFGR